LPELPIPVQQRPVLVVCAMTPQRFQELLNQVEVE
jgi:hypothetical protein